MRIIPILFLILLLTSSLQASQEVSLGDVLNVPSTYTGRTITVRGFLYQASDGQWILSKEPNLKSCCVGTKKRADSQVVVVGSIEPGLFGVAQQLTGRFEIEQEVFYLNEAIVAGRGKSNVSPADTCWLCILSPFILIVILLVIGVDRLRRH